MSKNQITYSENLALLNPEQRLAVETIDGPVMVIAGPGTGKTQILALRIGNILKKTDTNPNEILCVTFTEAGAVEMRSRLSQFIGAAAYNVPIHTFHSFCNMIIGENPEKFSESRDLRAITELEQRQLVKSMIDNWDHDFKLKRPTNPYYDAQGLLNLFSFIKRENFTSETLIKNLKEDIKDIEEDSDNISTRGKTKGKLKADAKKAIERLEKTIAAAGCYSDYDKLMKKQGYFDFDDMIRWVLDAFTNDESFLNQYSERFLYFLIDEFQDNNGSQADLIYLLASYWDKPNVFVVGDDDQSIFRFQGANFENILEFHSRYKEVGLTTVVLKNNYRSVPAVLKASSSLIRENKFRLVNEIEGLEKTLTAANSKLKDSKLTVKCLKCINPLHQDAVIIDLIKKWKSEGGEYSDTAILFGKNKEAEIFVKKLKKSGVAFSIKRRENILETPLIKMICDQIRYLSLEQKQVFSGDHLLFKLLHAPWFDVPAIELARLVTAWNAQRKEEDASFRSYLISHISMPEVSCSQALEEAIAFIEQLILECQNTTVQSLLEFLYRESGCLDYTLKQDDSRFLLESLSSLMNFVKDMSDNHKDFGLQELNQALTDLVDEGLSMPVERNIVDSQGVTLSTLHSSKGLQYKNVIIYNCISTRWESKRARNKGFKLPVTQSADDKLMSEEELRRLMFVGATRAEENLIFSYPSFDLKGKELSISKFIIEMNEQESIEMIDPEVDQDALAQYLIDELGSPTKLKSSVFDMDWLEEKLTDFVLSPTALNKFLWCPIQFYFENILRVPSARTANLGFGNAIHYALQYFMERFDKNKNEEVLLKELLQWFEKGMQQFHAHFTKQEFQDRVAFGEKILTGYLKARLEHWKGLESYKTEYRIPISYLEDVPLSGIIDLVEYQKDQISVVDYKTGKADPAKVKEPKGDENQALFESATQADAKKSFWKKWRGTDYWRQLVFYKIILEASSVERKEVIRGTMDFIHPKDNGQHLAVSRLITGEDLEIVKAQIKEAYTKIQAKEFDKGCSLEDCRWCEMVKNNDLTVDLR